MGLFKKQRTEGGSAQLATATEPAPEGRAAHKHLAAMPKWHVIERAMQFALAILVLGLSGYAEHVYHGSGLQPAYILAIVVASVTLLVFLPAVLLHQRGVFHPGATFAFDLVPMLLWLVTLAVLASYSQIFKPSFSVLPYYFDGASIVDSYRNEDLRLNLNERSGGQPFDDLYGKSSYFKELQRAWACGAAAAAFAGVEFLLFLLTTLLSLHSFHSHNYDEAPPPTFDIERGSGTTANSPFGATSIHESQFGGRNAHHTTMDHIEMEQQQGQQKHHDLGEPTTSTHHDLLNGDESIMPDAKIAHQDHEQKSLVADKVEA